MVDPETGLMDIVTPSAPPSPDWTGLALAMVALSVLMVLVLYRMQSRRQRASRRLARLRRRLRAGQSTPRAAAFETAALLRAGLQQARPEAAPGRGGRSDPQRWQQFMERLTTLRYARTPPSREQTLAAIGEARYWLRPWT